jgi:hypothetical protein
MSKRTAAIEQPTFASSRLDVAITSDSLSRPRRFALRQDPQFLLDTPAPAAFWEPRPAPPSPHPITPGIFVIDHRAIAPPPKDGRISLAALSARRNSADAYEDHPVGYASLRLTKREPTTNRVAHFCLSPPVQFQMSLDTLSPAPARTHRNMLASLCLSRRL